MRFYREFLPAAPRELNGFFATMTVPPADFLPAELHLRKVCGVMWCYTGAEEAAAELFAPVQEVGDAAAARRRADAVPGAPEPVRRRSTRPGCSGTGARTSCVELPRRGDRGSTPGSRTSCRRCTRRCTCTRSTGRCTTSAPSDTPFSYRDVNWAEVIVGVDPDPANAGLIRDWTVDYWDATHPYSAGGAYVNFMMDEGHARVRATYGDNYDRLAAAKATYDPANVFRVNQNIEPSVTA